MGRPKFQGWVPPKIWNNQTVYIIGGGPSLKDMDWTPYHHKHFIGCNDAYMLGNWVDVCCFGDAGWFLNFHWEWNVKKPEGNHPGLKQFPNLIVCNSEKNHKNIHKCAPHVKVMRRRYRGLQRKPGFLSWYFNTGMASTHLAILFGATRIVWLGFDCKDIEGKEEKEPNWHANLKNPIRIPRAIRKFRTNATRLKEDLSALDYEVEIINANPESGIPDFPKMDREEAMNLD